MKGSGAAVALCAVLAGCGLGVKAPDLFLLKRTGEGRPLTLLVNDSGTISCDGAPAKRLSDQLLIQARALAIDLAKDAKAALRIPAGPRSIFTFTVRLQDGTISFADTAAGTHPELSRAELFAVQAEHGPCALRG